MPVVGGVSSEWIIGWKIANIALDFDMKTIQFSPAAISCETYGVDAYAECRMVGDIHVAPEDSCKCGFNSWDDLGVALEYMKMHQTLRVGYAYRYPPRSIFRLSLVMLRVGMCDDVIEGTLDAGSGWNQWGYRAARQRVSDVFFDGKCAACSADAQHVCTTLHTTTPYGESLYPLAIFCDAHTVYGRRILDLDVLSAQNDIGIYATLPSP